MSLQTYSHTRRVILFFKASAGPGQHSNQSDQRSLAYTDEEYWWLPPQSGYPHCSELKGVRLYCTQPQVWNDVAFITS